MTMTRKEAIANRHRLAAEHKRAELRLFVNNEEMTDWLLEMIGVHTIQANLWEASHRADLVKAHKEANHAQI